MEKLILYNYFRSSTSYRVRIALYFKQLEFEYKAVSLIKGEHQESEYKKINPLGGVPTLNHCGSFLSQSIPIIEYLEEVFPSNPLLPKDPIKRAQIRQISEDINSFMHPLSNLQVQKYLEQKHNYNQAQKEEWIQHWSSIGFTSLEKKLSNSAGKYCFGNEITLADVCLVPMVFSAQRFNVKLDAFPQVLKINQNCVEIECFKKAHPYRQPDTPPELKII